MLLTTFASSPARADPIADDPDLAPAPTCDPSRFDVLVRFEWRRSFDPPIDVCAGRKSNTLTVIAKRGSYERVVTFWRQRALSAAEWATLERTLASAHLDSVKPRTIFDAMAGADGAAWSIRVDRGTLHQTAEEWAPAPAKPTRVVGQVMLDLAGRDMLEGSPVY